MTQTILVLGTNAGQADLIRHMKAMGWRVIGASPVAGEPGQAFCDHVISVDIRDLDALAKVVSEEAVDLVYSISSDVAIGAAVALSERLGMPHFHGSEFIALLDDKAALRAFLNERALSPVPFARVTGPTDLAGWSTYPAMVKPADAQGQRGVVRVDAEADLAKAVAAAQEASKTRTAIVEGFLDGVEISVNLLVAGGEIRLEVLSERLVHGPEALGVPRGHLVPPQNVPPAERETALTQVRAIVAALGAPDGPLYVQMILTPEGPRVVEIAPRLDGCHMWRLIKAATGADLLAMTVAALTGAPVETADPTPKGAWELMFQQMPPGGPFDPAAFPIPEGAVHHEYRYAPGETVRPVNGRQEVVGYFVGPSS